MVYVYLCERFCTVPCQHGDIESMAITTERDFQKNSVVVLVYRPLSGSTVDFFVKLHDFLYSNYHRKSQDLFF